MPVNDARRIGLGCMRLSTAVERDDGRSMEVVHAALNAGATLLDTSNAYCHDDSETGHNERIIARALATWSGDRSAIEVATKGGLRRPDGAWIADGKAKSLRAACEGSLRALGVDAIDLYQLHAVDSRTPFETSMRALAALRGEGKIRRVGLCNVTVGQIKAAREIVEIDSVQVSLSVLDDESLRNGVAEYCRDHGIRLIAYRPLGGVSKVRRLARDAALQDVGGRHDASPQEIALAWLLDLGVVPIPGATRVETAQSIGRALRVRLTDDDRRELDEKYSGRMLRERRHDRRPAPGARGDVVLIMGMPAAGKSEIARELAGHGYERLNRDTLGGTLSGLVERMDAGLAAGRTRWVLDNTYATRKSRHEVIECAWTHGVPVRCIHLTTSLADAQINAITRLIRIHGRLPMPDELRARGKTDPRYFGPDALFRYERSLEAPTKDEGFESVVKREFVRRREPDSTNRAVFMEYDEVLVTNAHGEGPALRPDDIALVDGARETLERLHAERWLLLAQAWRPQVRQGLLAADSVADGFQRTRELLGVPITLSYCPHEAGPPICWCRKPLPGLILEFALRNSVVLGDSLSVGRTAADRTVAQRLGVRYADSLAALTPTGGHGALTPDH